jgi:hypothetical protein
MIIEDGMSGWWSVMTLKCGRPARIACICRWPNILPIIPAQWWHTVTLCLRRILT